MAIYGKSKSGFDDGRRMHLWAHPNLAKSDKAKGTLTKACKRQKFF